MSSANARRPTRDSGTRTGGALHCARPSGHGGDTGCRDARRPLPPPSPGLGPGGRRCFRSFSEQAHLSQCLITESESHVCFLSEYRTCFWLILKPLFIWWWWVPAAVCRGPSLPGVQASLATCTRSSLAVTKSLLKHSGNREGSSSSWPQPEGLRQDQSLSLCRALRRPATPSTQPGDTVALTAGLSPVWRPTGPVPGDLWLLPVTCP